MAATTEWTAAETARMRRTMAEHAAHKALDMLIVEPSDVHRLRAVQEAAMAVRDARAAYMDALRAVTQPPLRHAEPGA